MSCLLHSSFFSLNKTSLFFPNSVNLDQLLGRNLQERLVCLSTTGFFYRSFFLLSFHNSVTMIKSLPPFISFASINALLQYPTQSLVRIDQPYPLALLGIKPWTLLEYISCSLDQQSAPLFS